ncbi:MAG: dihydrofolate reductase [Pseudomonadota bacterium]|nr:dihydrofolate reductase [Pseudomonadota bacterium]
MKNVSIIVALSENNVIGINNRLPWKLSDDLKNFKKITMGHTIIMGRMTYESIGRPLPGRKNIVVSRKKNKGDLNHVNSIEDALYISEGEEEIFIIGGEQIFKQTLNLASKIYLTKIHSTIEGDKFFPKIDFDKWDIKQSEKYSKNNINSHSFTFQILEKINT